jgi:hypothetical protein
MISLLASVGPGDNVLEILGEFTEHVFIFARHFQVGIFFATDDAIPNNDSILSLCPRQEMTWLIG